MDRTLRVPARDKSRGVAALEFALSLTFLVPLLMGMLDFGYYFWISTNAEEAARAGVRDAVRASAGAVCGAIVTNLAKTNGETPAVGTGSACIGGAAYCYMNEPPLFMGAASGPTTVTVTCLSALPNVDPTWQVSVQVDFQPSLGFFKNLMKAGAGGTVRYTATAAAAGL